MKKFVLYILIVLAGSLVACKDKLDLTGDAKTSAVVIGILDPSNTAHFVKITKTFIGDGITNSLDIAKIADSSYFKNVQATVEEVFPNGTLGRTFNLHDTIIKDKDQNGVFYAPEQKVYVFYTPPSDPLKDDAIYRIKINIDNGNMIITGETKIVKNITLHNNWTGFNRSFSLAGTGAELGAYSDYALTVSNVGNSYRINGKLRFDYQDSLSNNTVIDHSVWMELGESDVTPGSSHVMAVRGKPFYTRLSEAIPTLSAPVSYRKHKGFHIEFVGASMELVNYMYVNRPSSSLAQNKPRYTNLSISGNHKVIGIFASRRTVSVYKKAFPDEGESSMTMALNEKSRRELCQGPLTIHLGFCSNHPADNSKTWGCP